MTMRLADQLFLLGHEVPSGRPRLSADVLAVGLAGALLGEGLLPATSPGLGPGHNRGPGPVVAPPVHESSSGWVGDGIERLRPHAVRLVLDRLIRDGDLYPGRGRSAWWGRPRYVAARPAAAFMIGQRLSALLRSGVPLDVADLVLAALAMAALPGAGLPELSHHGRSELQRQSDRLPVVFGDLIAGTRDAVRATLTPWQPASPPARRDRPRPALSAED